MMISPQANIVYLKMDEVKAGALDTSSRSSAVECAEVLSIGQGVTGLKPGDKVFVKSWSVDIVTYNDERYYFVNVETGGILAVLE